MRFHFIGPTAGMLLLVLAGATFADGPMWRPLKIDGHTARWSKPLDDAGRQTLSWRIVESVSEDPKATNCRLIGSPATLLNASGIAASTFRRELQGAFEMWQIAAGIQFVEAQPGIPADISIGAQLQPEGRAFADVAIARGVDGTDRAISRSLICLNPAVRWKVGFDGNLDIYDLRHTFAHEIGHAIGLDHPRQRGSLMWFRYDESVRGLQRGDVEGAAALYGGPPSSRHAGAF